MRQLRRDTKRLKLFAKKFVNWQMQSETMLIKSRSASKKDLKHKMARNPCCLEM